MRVFADPRLPDALRLYVTLKTWALGLRRVVHWMDYPLAPWGFWWAVVLPMPRVWKVTQLLLPLRKTHFMVK